MSTSQDLGPVHRYYTGTLRAHGRTARGVDWNSAGSQNLRFDQLLKVCDFRRSFSLQDYGCGYGALLARLRRRRAKFVYEGFDLSEEMIAAARRSHGNASNARFRVGDGPAGESDYVVASGVFNVRLKASRASWRKHMEESIRKMDRSSRRGFAFNCLTSYSEREKMKASLYYADPLDWFDTCKRLFSPQVALLHDYGLWEFTILVRKEGAASPGDEEKKTRIG